MKYAPVLFSILTNGVIYSQNFSGIAIDKKQIIPVKNESIQDSKQDTRVNAIIKIGKTMRNASIKLNKYCLESVKKK